jgi:hypothetical protein
MKIINNPDVEILAETEILVQEGKHVPLVFCIEVRVNRI